MVAIAGDETDGVTLAAEAAGDRGADPGAGADDEQRPAVMSFRRPPNRCGGLEAQQRASASRSRSHRRDVLERQRRENGVAVRAMPTDALDLVGLGLRTSHRDAAAVLRGLRRHPMSHDRTECERPHGPRRGQSPSPGREVVGT